MKIRYNEDAELVARLREALVKRELQCPCRFQKKEDNICMCKEFREQIADPEFEGYCHCRLSSKDKSGRAAKREEHRRKTVLFSFQ